MESHSVAGEIQVTERTYERLRDDYVFEYRGPIDVKGKGEMETWFLIEAAGRQSGKGDIRQMGSE
jgi:class 3 adenylate cyclase